MKTGRIIITLALWMASGTLQGATPSGSVQTADGDPIAARISILSNFGGASPAAHVSPDDPPFLMIHGTADDRVPHARSQEFLARLEADGIEAELVTIQGGGHGAAFPGAKDPPDYLGAMVDFFEEHLAQGAAAEKSPPSRSRNVAGIDRDVSFGMVSGGALLMDVYRPEHPNGHGILHITGSGWHSSLEASAPQQKASRQVEVFGLPLVKAVRCSR